ncbi:MAG: ATP-binding protein [Victivallaceae bacterium]|nr:ATP-binding protein [Victivallaceae bacterium]
MNIAIASGKGGTGKTTVALSLARVRAEKRQEKVRLIDCDVEAPNDHLFLDSAEVSTVPVTLPKPVIDEKKCTACGKCARTCNYNALTVIAKKVLPFNELCHSCGVCGYVCPEKAVSYRPVEIGKIHSVRSGPPFALSWGELAIGQVQAPDIIRELRHGIRREDINIFDSSPGCGCAVRETLAGMDAVILVTEPTPFGLNDLRLAAELAGKLGIPTGIVINRSDGNDKIIEDFARESGVEILTRIPFERKYAETYSRGIVLAEKYPEIETLMDDLYGKIKELIERAPEKRQSVLGSIPESGGVKPVPAASRDGIKEAVVISGKGGTGKTTVCASLAALRPGNVFFDADVDASNLPILLKSKTLSTWKFTSGAKAFIDYDKCAGCGGCSDLCRFKAVRRYKDGTYQVVPGACEGCGLCELVCPAGAVEMIPADTGYTHLSASEYGKLAHAFLNIGEENSGKLVTEVKNLALAVAAEEKDADILGDGSPGTGCPVIAAMAGSNLALAVTEPTVSGIHDLKRVLALAAHFDITGCVVINKADINPDKAAEIKDFCRVNRVEVIGEIPFDEAVGRALREGRHLLEISSCPARTAVENISGQLKLKFNI